MKWIDKFIDLQRAKGRDVLPLFGFLETQDPPAAPSMSERPTSPGVRVADLTAPQAVPRVESAAPCPLMEQARADLEATADQIVAQAAGLVAAGPLRLYRLLVVSALGRLVAQGVTQFPTIGELHMPGELAALLLGVDRSTVWRWANALDAAPDEETGEIRGAGLIARCDHKATSAAPYGASDALDKDKARKKAAGEKVKRFRHVSDGTVWAVSLHGRSIPGLQVSWDSKAHAWRDLAADARHAHQNATKTEAGYTYAAEGLNTVWALKKTGLQQSLEGLKAEKSESLAVRWAVNPGLRTISPVQVTVANGGAAAGTAFSGIWDVLGVRGLGRKERGAAVDEAAHRLAAALGDMNSVGLYRWVLWRLFRLDIEGIDRWDTVVTILAGLKTEADSGECRSPGAVFIHRLKRAGLWELLRNVGAYRVGVAPV